MNTIRNTPNLWLSRFPFPKPEGHKYDRGSALIYGGAVMTGAARLAARAAQRIGAGLVTLAAPSAAYAIYAESLESVIVRETPSLGVWQELLADAKRNAVLIGPGLGLSAAHKDYVLAALHTGKSCVLDADALTNFADDPDQLINALHAKCVLTPHEGEFTKLFGHAVDAGLSKAERASRAAQIAGCVVLLKGHETFIAKPDGDIVMNNNAPAWLATAGAGDVLAGIILGLLAQGISVFDAAACAAWTHGKAAADFGPGLIAEDVIDGIPQVLRELSAASSPL